VQAENIASQPVGLAAALKGAEERIANVKKIQPNERPILAIEGFIIELLPNE
jgi:non-canonical (house-cleaning) NTP pyrophosphatase